MNCSSPGSSVCEILWVRILEWVAIPFSRGSSYPETEARSPALQAILYHLSHQGIPYKQDGDEQDIILACQAEKDPVKGDFNKKSKSYNMEQSVL